MSDIQQLNRALLRTLMSAKAADIVADRLEELERELDAEKARADQLQERCSSEWGVAIERDALATQLATLQQACHVFIEARKHHGYGMDEAEKAIRAAIAATPESAAKELAELRAWKESALAVEREWDAQALATMLGAKLGQSCRKAIAEKVPALLSELAQLRDDRARMDWLENFFATTESSSNAWQDFESDYWSRGFRAAIDARKAVS